MLRAVLFDFDGVIVDTEPLHLSALNGVLVRHGVPAVPAAEYCEHLLGLDDAGLFRRGFAGAGEPLDADLLARLVAQKSRRFLRLAQSQEVVLPGVREFLASVDGRYLLAICSGALRHEIEAILERAGLRRHFAAIVAAEDVERGKPDPQGYLLACRRLGDTASCRPPLQADECLVVEDSLPGIEAAREAGMRCVAVATSHGHERLGQADAVVHSLGEVGPELLARLFAP